MFRATRSEDKLPAGANQPPEETPALLPLRASGTIPPQAADGPGELCTRLLGDFTAGESFLYQELLILKVEGRWVQNW